MSAKNAAFRLDRTLYDVRPAAALLGILRAYTFIIVAMAVALYSHNVILWAAAIMLIGSQQYALQIILHDGLHGRLLKAKWQSDLLCRAVLANFLLTPFSAFRDKHLSHHRHLGTSLDPDRYYHRSEDKSTPPDYLLFLTAFRSIILTLIRAASRGARTRQPSPQGPTLSPGGATALVDVLAVLFTNAVIAGLMTVYGGWYAYPALWIVPFVVALYIPQNFRSFAEHAQAEPDETADSHRLVTFTSSPIERWFLAPNNMNYHAEHHLYPAVPYYNLPRLRQYLEAHGQMTDVEYRRSYMEYARRYWRALPLPMGTHVSPVQDGSA